MLLKTKIMVVVGIAIAVMIAGFYWYYQSTQKRLQEAAQEIALQKVQIANQQQIIEQIQKDISNQSRLRQSLNNSVKQTQRDVENMRRIFTPINPQTGETTTVGVQAVQQPVAIEQRINTKSQEQWRCFELLTGDRLDEEEANGKKINSICQALLDQRIADTKRR